MQSHAFCTLKEGIMSKKMHDILRKVQLILPDLLSLYAILDTCFGWNTMSVATKIVPILISIIGHVVQGDSDEYFSTRTVIDKITPEE